MPAKHFNLDRMNVLAELSGHPENSAPSIHIAGSKGKGTVTSMIAGILRAGGKKTGSYLSPHVSNWRERICLNGGFFPEEIYRKAGTELYRVYRRFRKDQKDFLGEPAFFELLTLFFFLCVRSCRCDVMILETGLGGRLDATNIVNPLVSVITLIEKEHTEYLGTTLAKIAAEKGGIVKPGRPLVLAEQKRGLLNLFEKIARDRGSPLFYLPRRAKISALRVDRTGTGFTLRMGESPSRNNAPRKKDPAAQGPGLSSLESKPSFAGPKLSFAEPKLSSTAGLGLFVPLPGKIQAFNAALAVLAVRSAFPGIGEGAIEEGLAALSLPGRFEKLRENPPLIVDGAHTPGSAALCAETFCTLYGRGGILLFGCAKGKNVRGMAESLLPGFSRVIITSPGTFRESDPAEVYRIFCRGSFGDFPREISLVPDTKEALKKTLRLAEEKQLPVLACGSFYLAGELRNMPEDPS
jgi:dihydrofolate synthase/folylpolyglutamate synthase